MVVYGGNCRNHRFFGAERPGRPGRRPELEFRIIAIVEENSGMLARPLADEPEM
jgi:hypothetical protein